MVGFGADPQLLGFWAGAGLLPVRVGAGWALWMVLQATGEAEVAEEAVEEPAEAS